MTAASGQVVPSILPKSCFEPFSLRLHRDVSVVTDAAQHISLLQKVSELRIQVHRPGQDQYKTFACIATQVCYRVAPENVTTITQT